MTEYGWRYIGAVAAMQGVIRVGYMPMDAYPGEWEQVSRTVSDWTPTGRVTGSTPADEA